MADNSHIASVEDRYNDVLGRVKRAAEKSGRSVVDVAVVAATKTIPVVRIVEAFQAGLTAYGENKVQEAALKQPSLQPLSLQAHLIGHLQRNKARKAIELFDLIQTVDSPRLAEALDRIAGEMGVKQDCLIEVKITSEPNKTGLVPAEAGGLIRDFKRYTNLNLKGLMTIAPLDVEESVTREAFRSFRGFFDDHRDCLGEAPILSMGMTDDFEIALEEGSTMIRIGRALFGERKVWR